MIIVRMAKGITDHLPARASEWALALILFRIGQILLDEQLTFTSPSMSELAKWANEETWGMACLAMGGIRIVALIINGSFIGFRFSPHMRALMAFFSCFFWFSIAIGILRTGTPSTGNAVYPVLLFLDMYNGYRAAGDARAVDLAARNAAT